MADDQNLDQNLEVEAVEAEVPAWVPEKFKSDPSKFGESYSNLEREFHETRRQLKAQQETMEQYIATQQQAAAEAPVEQNTDQLYAAYEQDPVGTMAWLAQQAVEQGIRGLQPQLQAREAPIRQAQNDLLAYTVDQMVASQIPDWADQKQKVADYVQARPYLLTEQALASPQTASEALVSAYKSMRFDDIQNQGQSQAETLRAENERLKIQAQTLTGSPGSPAQTDADTDYWKSVASVKTNRYGG